MALTDDPRVALTEALGPGVRRTSEWAPVYRHWEDADLGELPVGEAAVLELDRKGVVIHLHRPRSGPLQVTLTWHFRSYAAAPWRVAPDDAHLGRLARAGFSVGVTDAATWAAEGPVRAWLDTAVGLARLCLGDPVRILVPEDVPDLRWDFLGVNSLWGRPPARVERAPGQARLAYPPAMTVIWAEGPDLAAFVSWLERFRPAYAALFHAAEFRGTATPTNPGGRTRPPASPRGSR